MGRPRPLQCPFCDSYLRAPVDIVFGTLELCGGICQCRSVYALDRTGHNMGEVFMDALTFVCKGDIDRALSLTPDQYETMEFDYDVHANTVGRTANSIKVSRIIFIRLRNEKEQTDSLLV